MYNQETKEEKKQNKVRKIKCICFNEITNKQEKNKNRQMN